MAERRAFTITELLVVIFIIAVLAGALVPALMHFRTAARITKAQADMAQIATGIEQFKGDNGFYPRVQNGWVTGTGKPGDASGWNNARINNQWLTFLLTAGSVADPVRWNSFSVNVRGTPGDYAPKSLRTGRGSLSVGADYVGGEVGGGSWSSPSMFLDPWDQPYIYVGQRGECYQCTAACFNGFETECAHLVDPADPSSAHVPQFNVGGRSLYGRPDSTLWPGAGFEYMFELWSAGPNKEMTPDVRKTGQAPGLADSVADKDNIPGTKY